MTVKLCLQCINYCLWAFNIRHILAHTIDTRPLAAVIRVMVNAFQTGRSSSRGRRGSETPSGRVSQTPSLEGKQGGKRSAGDTFPKPTEKYRRESKKVGNYCV